MPRSTRWVPITDAELQMFAGLPDDRLLSDEEMRLIVYEIQEMVSQSIDVSSLWATATITGLNRALPTLKRGYLREHADCAESPVLQLGYWLLWSAWQNESVRAMAAPHLPFGFSAGFLILGASECLQAMVLERSLIATMTEADQLRIACRVQRHMYHAATCWGFVQIVLPFECESLHSQAQRVAQRLGQTPFLRLKQEAITRWREGVASGKWKRSGHGNGPKKAATQIALQLQPLAAELLTGKKARRGIATGGHDRVYQWILEDLNGRSSL